MPDDAIGSLDVGTQPPDVDGYTAMTGKLDRIAYYIVQHFANAQLITLEYSFARVVDSEVQCNVSADSQRRKHSLAAL